MVQGPESCGADPPVQTRLPVAGGLVHHLAARPPQHRPHHHWPETASVTRRPALRAPPPTGGKNLCRQAELRRWTAGGGEAGGAESAVLVREKGHRSVLYFFIWLGSEGAVEARLPGWSGSKDPTTRCAHSH